MSFGKKGAGAARPSAASSNDDMAAKRAAFLAAERQRNIGTDGQIGSHPSLRPNPGPSGFAPAGFSHDEARSALGIEPAPKSEKSLGIAYLCWFLLGQFGAHRFYLGAHQSAIIQAFMVFGSAVIVLLTLNPKDPGMGVIFVLPMMLGMIWLLADAFLIPGIYDRLNGRDRRESFNRIFG